MTDQPRPTAADSAPTWTLTSPPADIPSPMEAYDHAAAWIERFRREHSADLSTAAWRRLHSAADYLNGKVSALDAAAERDARQDANRRAALDASPCPPAILAALGTYPPAADLGQVGPFALCRCGHIRSSHGSRDGAIACYMTGCQCQQFTRQDPSARQEPAARPMCPETETGRSGRQRTIRRCTHYAGHATPCHFGSWSLDDSPEPIVSAQPRTDRTVTQRRKDAAKAAAPAFTAADLGIISDVLDTYARSISSDPKHTATRRQELYRLARLAQSIATLRD